jgi:hypothetical protein
MSRYAVSLGRILRIASLSASSGPSRNIFPILSASCKLASHLVCAAFTPSGFSYWMIMSFS